MRSHTKRRVSFLFPILLFLLLSAPSATAQHLRCTRVIDAYTIELSDREIVQLIGVADPEIIKHPGIPVGRYNKQSAAFTRKMVEGKPVRLEYDWQQRDTYGRLLAYVYLLNGSFLNAEIIKQGYGHVSTQFPFRYQEEFKQYEKASRAAKRGLWAEDEVLPGKRKLIKEEYVGTVRLRVYHGPHCTIAQEIRLDDRRVFNSVKEAVDAGYLPCKICRPPYYK